MTRAVSLSSLLLFSACGGDDFDPMGHGSLKIEFQRAQNVAGNPADPYAKAPRASIVLDRGPCLMQFYEAHPEWEKTGTKGKPVFDAWRDRLCELSTVPCTVNKYSGPPFLLVYYDVDGTLEDQTLYVGPIPLPELADCEGKLEPSVLFGPTSFAGVKSDGSPAWVGAEVSAHSAVADQDEPIVVEAIGSPG